jgi:hypothetical protein
MILIFHLAEGLRCQGCGAIDAWCDRKLLLCLYCAGLHLATEKRHAARRPPLWLATLARIRWQLLAFRRSAGKALPWKMSVGGSTPVRRGE